MAACFEWCFKFTNKALCRFLLRFFLNIFTNAGLPTPDVRWFRGDVDVTSSFNYEIVYAPDGRTSLRIDEVFDEDAGQFTCLAENELGQASSVAELVVQSE